MRYALLVVAALGLVVYAGCRSKSDRNGDRDYRNGNGTMVEKAKDPVCGMTCDRNDSLKYTWQGKDYYFCHQECMKKFQDNPGKYAGNGNTNDRYPTDRSRTPQ